MLPTLVKETGNAVDASVIWLHGLGADGHDFAPIVPELKLPESAGIRFIFPHAPNLPVTINGGYQMPAWYDILEMQLERRVDVAQLQASAAQIIELIEREINRGIASDRIILAGFSQGGAVAYEAALSYTKPLGGVLALSTYLATADTLKAQPANQHIPIAIFHGSMDPIVPESLGIQAEQTLQQRGYTTHYHSYPMEHSVHPDEIAQIAIYLRKWLDINTPF